MALGFLFRPLAVQEEGISQDLNVGLMNHRVCLNFALALVFPIPNRQLRDMKKAYPRLLCVPFNTLYNCLITMPVGLQFEKF